MRQKTFINNVATLYLVATPIGNMSEFTPRAIEILKNVSVIGCEDTRTSGILLNRFQIQTPVASYHKFNEKECEERFLVKLREGKDVALISDAGYPLVSDPGSVLVNSAIEEGFNVTTVSGSCAFINALVASGFSLSRFTFIGFLDSKSTARTRELRELSDKEETLIFYESPHRIKECLEDMLEIFGDRRVVVARELTKKFEEYLRGNISELIEECDTLKGEMVVIVEGATKQEKEIDLQQVNLDIQEMKKNGENSKEIIAQICLKYGLKKNYVYDLVCKK